MARFVRNLGFILAIGLLVDGAPVQAQVRPGVGVPAAGMTSTGINPIGAGTMVGGAGNIYSNPYGAANPYGWGPVISTYYDPYGGYLRGVADLTNAYGNYAIQSQQANVVNQDYRKAKIENKRRMFDEWLYERNNMPTYMDDKDKLIRENLRYSLNQPSPGDVQNGFALNQILENILKLPGQGVGGPEMPLKAEILAQINVTGNAQTGGNIGILKGFQTSNKFDFPLALTSEDFKAYREELDSQTAKLIELTKNNKRDVTAIKLARTASKNMEKQLIKLSNELTPMQYIDAKRFINDYNDALKIFESPNASSYFNDSFAARGKNVSELVHNMASNGLRFAPSVPGQENAYTSVHSSLANYYVATSGALMARQPR